MITKKAQDAFEKEAFIGAAFKTLGKSLLTGSKAAVKAAPAKVGSRVQSIGRGITSLPRAAAQAPRALNTAKAAFKGASKGSFMPNKLWAGAKAAKSGFGQRVADGVSGAGKVDLKNLANATKMTAGIGGGAYLGNKMFGMGQAQD